MNNPLIDGTEMPKFCIECWFLAIPIQIKSETPDRCKYISRCLLSPKEVEDPWRDEQWFSENKESWCPLREVKTPIEAEEGNNA